MYDYLANVTRLVDADTFDVAIDLGFRDTRMERLRLYGVNAPEMRTTEGKAARAYVVDWFGALPSAVTVRTHKVPPQSFPAPYDNFGRYLAEVFRNGRSLAGDLLESGHAVPYFG